MSSSEDSSEKVDEFPATLSSSSAKGQPPNKRKKKNQVFVDAWLTNSEFRSWLVKKVGARNQVIS